MKKELEKILESFDRILPYKQSKSQTADKILQLFQTKIDSIPITELLMVFDKYKTNHDTGQGHILYDVYFIEICVDILAIIKERCNK